MKSILIQALRVKELREERASEVVQRCRRELDAAAVAAERARRGADDYRDWRIAEEDRRFDELCGTPTRRGAIEDLRLEIENWREHSAALDSAARAAAEKEAAATEKLAEARTAHLTAVHERDGFHELYERELAKLRRAAERASEMEIEEAAQRMAEKEANEWVAR